MAGISAAIIVFGDYLLIFIAIMVFSCSIYALVQRCKKDRVMIRQLTSTQRVVPAIEITVIQPTPVVYTIPTVPPV